MLVVPLAKDTIETKEGGRFKVVEYTNYKEGGPAVYARVRDSRDVVLVYFFDILSINGTRVEYQKGSRVFTALGHIAREQQLPQPDDIVIVRADHFEAKKNETKEVEVDSLKLKSKSLRINKGMFVRDVDGNFYRLKDILGIKRALGGSAFNKQSFLEYYKEYIGV